MDSLTQITLGAAIGEAVLGKRVGNRAMLWGAVGGTLPDFDTLANFVTDPVSSLAYHRAVSHSLFFALLVPPMLGWLVHRIYSNRGDTSWYGAWLTFAVALTGILITGAAVLPIPMPDAIWVGGMVSMGILCIPLAIGFREQFRKEPSDNPNASWRAWTLLFFAAIVTHPLLDSCTTFGTQLFQPFFDTRVGWNNVSVVDPLYTVPLLICVIIAMRLPRESKRRRWVNALGLVLSTGYLVFTLYNKTRVNAVFERSMVEQGIEYQRYMTAPTLLNNILWQATAESESSYYYGYYSLLDSEPWFLDIEEVPKNHHLLDPYSADSDVAVLKWFSNGYYNVEKKDDGSLIFNDLRFGKIRSSPSDTGHFVFKFALDPEGPHELKASQEQAGRRDLDGAFTFLLKRMLGR